MLTVPTFDELFAETLRRDVAALTAGLDAVDEAIALTLALEGVTARLDADEVGE